MLRQASQAARVLPRAVTALRRTAVTSATPSTSSVSSSAPPPPSSSSSPSIPPSAPPSSSPPSSRRVRRPRPPAALSVTPAALERIRTLLASRDPRPAGVRIGLRTRGCNGMAYVLNYADAANKFDEAVHLDGAAVFIDPRALIHIVGTTMDFVDNDLVSEFVFHNPNAKGTCGCGESFSV